MFRSDIYASPTRCVFINNPNVFAKSAQQYNGVVGERGEKEGWEEINASRGFQIACRRDGGDQNV
jgi:hypothetical protein